MYNTMKKLIGKRFYKTAEDAQSKIDVFFAVGRLSDAEYTAALCAEIYGV